MTQYKDKVEQHGLLLEAEAWAKGIKQVHTFDSDNTTMAYDYPNPTREGYVTDTTFNDGRVQRVVHSTQKKYIIGKRLSEKDLINKYVRVNNE